MKQSIVRWATAVALAGASVAPAVLAQDAAKTLPTLLVKGQIVLVDTNDPTATLVKVKDRYGFETPIYLTSDTTIAQGDQALTVADLKPETPVEVEYNFDINTAKRHAVSVKVSAPAATASAATPQPTVPSPAPAATPEAMATPAPAAPSEPAPAEPAAPAVTEPSTATPTTTQ